MKWKWHLQMKAIKWCKHTEEQLVCIAEKGANMRKDSDALVIDLSFLEFLSSQLLS